MKERAYLAVITGAFIGGLGGVFIKCFTIPATSIAWIRTFIPCLVLAFFIHQQGLPFFRGNYKVMLGASALNVIRIYLFMTAFIYTSISSGIVIFYTWPIFATIFGVLFLKEKISLKQILLLALSFAGIIIAYSEQTFSFENKDFIGMSAALGSAFIYALMVIIFKTESKNYTPDESIFYQNLLGALVFLPFFVFNEPAPTLFDIQIGIIYGVLIGVLAFRLFFFGLKHLPASRVSMLTYSEVISAILLGFFVLGEVLSFSMLIGGSCIILSTILLRLGS